MGRRGVEEVGTWGTLEGVVVWVARVSIFWVAASRYTWVAIWDFPRKLYTGESGNDERFLLDTGTGSRL